MSAYSTPIATVRLEVIEAGDKERELVFILSRKAGLSNWEKETPEGNHDSLPALVSVSIIPLRFNMHSDYFY